MDASEIPFDADLITRFERALQSFSADVGRLEGVRSPVHRLRALFAAGPGEAIQDFRQPFSDDAAAKSDLLFRTYSEVLLRFGAPEHIQVTNSGQVYWRYPHGFQIWFFDGMVTNVST